MTYQPGTYQPTRTDVTKAQMDNIEGELVTLDTRGVLVTGAYTPVDRADLGPMSGEWGWSGALQAWVGPAYPVTWQDGDNVTVPTGAFHNDVYVVTAPVGQTPTQSADAGPDYPRADNSGAQTPATNAGSGVILILQVPTVMGSGPAQPSLTPLTLRGDLVLLASSPVAYAAEPGTGKDGDHFIDTTPGVWKLYGPRANGVWGTGLTIGGA